MTHINVSEVLSSLSLAKEAYEALPDLRRQIDDLQAAVASKDRLIDKVQTELGETIQGKANVELKLKQTEEERDAYGFRAIDAEEKLEKVFGVVRPAAPAPQPPVVDQSATTPTAQTAQATSGAVSADTAKSSSTEPGQSAPLPTPAPASTTTGTTEPIGDTNQGPHGVPIMSPSENWGKQSDSGVTSPNQGFTETVARSAQSPHWSGSEQHDSGDEDHVVVDKPYLGHPSWEKPHDMAWNEWEAKGGTVPGWMKSAH